MLILFLVLGINSFQKGISKTKSQLLKKNLALSTFGTEISTQQSPNILTLKSLLILMMNKFVLSIIMNFLYFDPQMEAVLMVLLHVITFLVLKSWHPDHFLNNFYRFSDFCLLILEILVVFKAFFSDSFVSSRGFSLAILYTLISYSFLNLFIVLFF